MQKTPHYNILNKMISNHEELWEENIAQLLLSQVGKKFLIEFKEPISTLGSWSITTNLWGNINFRNQYDFYSNHKDILIKKVDTWKQLLDKLSPDITQTLEYEFKNTNYKALNFKSSYNGLLALRSLSHWFKFYSEFPQKYALNKEDEKLIVYDFIGKEPYSRIFSTELEKNSELSKYLINILFQNITIIKKELKKNDEELTNLLLDSLSFKALVNSCELEDITKLFNPSSLRGIIKKSQLKENLSSNINMLSNLMPIAPAKDWIECYSKEANLLSLFTPLLKKGSGYTITEIEDALHNRQLGRNNKVIKPSERAQKEMLLQLEYLEEELKDYKMKEKDSFIWYGLIMKTGNINLFKKSLSLIPLPVEQESSQNFYKNLFNRNNSNTLTWSDVVKEYEYERLHKKINLQSTELKDKKRIKI